MESFVARILDSSFMPHGTCYQWQPDVLWLHAGSDSLIALAYFSIPLALIYFVRKRRDVEFGWMFLMFSAFILLCGLTHLLGVYTIWNATYRLTGLVKLATGAVSITTAIALIPLMPKALALPSPSQLRDVNEALRREIKARSAAEDELRRLNEDLERRIAERSSELQRRNAELQAEVENHRRTQEALGRSEAQFRQVTESVPQLIWTAGADGTVTYYNSRWKEFHGFVQQDGGSWQWGEAVHPDDRARTVAAWEHALERGAPYEVEHRVMKSDKTYRWFLSRALPLVDYDGNVSQWYGSATDIHDQKEAESALRQREAELESLTLTLEQRIENRTSDLRHANEILRQRNEELQEFAYVASHDLKEPLRKVRTFSGMLVDEYADRLEGDGRMYVERMQDAVERMMILINDLLALSRVSTRTQPFQQVALQSVLDDVLTDFDIDLERTGGRIEVVTPLPVIEADPSQMRQLFQNLIGNAVKYARAEEPPIIRIGSASTETDEGYPAVQLRVEDNGIGFDPKYADRIFGAFQRLHGRGQYEGSGMGLAICKRIVERHRGRIAVESTPGQGAAFIVTLPTSARSTNESEA